MDHCCQSKDRELAQLRERQGRVLRLVLALNAALFVIEFSAGWWSGSTALLGDSLDMLGDALVYGFSLYVLHRSALWRVRAAQAKGVIMALFAASVLAQAAIQLVGGSVPDAPAMGAIGGLALAGNVTCFALLYRHRSDDLNLRSTWLCSRNDLVANTAVLLAAGAVAATGSLWPDLLVGVAIAALFAQGAWVVLRESIAELGRVRTTASRSLPIHRLG